MVFDMLCSNYRKDKPEVLRNAMKSGAYEHVFSFRLLSAFRYKHLTSEKKKEKLVTGKIMVRVVLGAK